MTLVQSALNRNAMLARGDRLAEFLNYEEAADTAEELLHQLEKLQGLLDRVIEKGRYIHRQPVFPENADRDTGLWCWWAEDKKVAALLPKVDGKLAEYGWEVLWMVKLTRKGPLAVPLWLKNPLRPNSGQPFGYMLRDCLEDRSLARIRRCPVCRRWFFAGREDQKNCSKRCRDKCGVHSTPEKWKAYMKDRMRRTRRRAKINTEIGLLIVTKPLGWRKRQVELDAEFKSLQERTKRHAKS
jgi:hypothetical protein